MVKHLPLLVLFSLTQLQTIQNWNPVCITKLNLKQYLEYKSERTLRQLNLDKPHNIARIQQHGFMMLS